MFGLVPGNNGGFMEIRVRCIGLNLEGDITQPQHQVVHLPLTTTAINGRLTRLERFRIIWLRLERIGKNTKGLGKIRSRIFLDLSNFQSWICLGRFKKPSPALVLLYLHHKVLTMGWGVCKKNFNFYAIRAWRHTILPYTVGYVNSNTRWKYMGRGRRHRRSQRNSHD